MPVIRAHETVVHELHGSRFTSYTTPTRGSQELCAWRLEIPAGTTGVAHSVTREEIVFMLRGTLRVTLNDGAADLAVGDAVVVPAGSALQVDNACEDIAAAWVTTTVGFEAVLADGSRIAPPWAR